MGFWVFQTLAPPTGRAERLCPFVVPLESQPAYQFAFIPVTVWPSRFCGFFTGVYINVGVRT